MDLRPVCPRSSPARTCLHVPRRRLRIPRICETSQLDRTAFGHCRTGTVCTYLLSGKMQASAQRHKIHTARKAHFIRFLRNSDGLHHSTRRNASRDSALASGSCCPICKTDAARSWQPAFCHGTNWAEYSQHGSARHRRGRWLGVRNMSVQPR